MATGAHQTEGYHRLDMKVVRCASERHGFTWRALCDGQLVGYSSKAYSTRAEAFRAANAAARAISKGQLVQIWSALLSEFRAAAEARSQLSTIAA